MKATITDYGTIKLEPENNAERYVLKQYADNGLRLSCSDYIGGDCPMTLRYIEIIDYKPKPVTP